MTGRVAHAIEIAPAYIDVAVKRWQAFTGQQATLDGDGRSFDQIAAERNAVSAPCSRRYFLAVNVVVPSRPAKCFANACNDKNA